MKSVLIDVIFEGNGIVNFDDGERQMDILRAIGMKGILHKDIGNKNIKIAKHEYYPIKVSEENDEVKYGYKIKVSSDCLQGRISKMPAVMSCWKQIRSLSLRPRMKTVRLPLRQTCR